MFSAWCARALQLMPYMAPVLYAFRPLADPNLAYAGCDEKMRLYLNFNTIKNEGLEFGAQVLLHECSHVLANHFELSKLVEHRVAQVWLIATDLAINDDLVSDGCTELARVGHTPRLHRLPDGRDPIWYYHQLLQQPDSPKQTPKGIPWDCGPGAGGDPLPGQLDAGDDLDGQATGATSGEIERAREACAAEIIAHQKLRGNLPGWVTALAEAILTPPKVDWRRQLTGLIRREVGRYRSGNVHNDWSRRSRRHTGTNIRTPDGTPAGKVFMPATREPVVTVAVVVDTSGSVNDHDLGVALGQITQISKQLGIRGRDLRFLTVDTEIGMSATYRSPESLLGQAGRGGTDMTVGIRAVEEFRPRPALCLVLTDGETPWPASPGPVPVVAGIVGTDRQHQKVQGRVPSWMPRVNIPTD